MEFYEFIESCVNRTILCDVISGRFLRQKNYKLKILAWAFRLIKSFEIYTYRVHVTSSKSTPLLNFKTEKSWKMKELETSKISLDISAQEFWAPIA